MRSFDVFLDLHLNKRLSKQSWGWWFETPLHPLWHHCNELTEYAPHPTQMGKQYWVYSLMVCNVISVKNYIIQNFNIKMLTYKDKKFYYEDKMAMRVFYFQYGISNACKTWHLYHWNWNVILRKFSSPDALEVVILTTFSATSGENVIKMMTFPFQWYWNGPCQVGIKNNQFILLYICITHCIK